MAKKFVRKKEYKMKILLGKNVLLFLKFYFSESNHI